MPCANISELGLARFHPEKGLIEYNLRKETCGASIDGERLLNRFFLGQSPESIGNLSFEDLEAQLSPRLLVTNHDERKLAVALFCLCRAYLGLPHNADSLSLSSIDRELDGTLVLAHVIDNIPEHAIDPCGPKCATGSCGKK